MTKAESPTSGGLWCPRGIEVTLRGAGAAPEQFQFERPFARIGRHPQADVVVSEPGLLPCHLLLHVSSDGIYCLGLADGAANGWMYSKVRAKLGPYLISAKYDGHETPPPNLAPDPVYTSVLAEPWPRFEIATRKRSGKIVERPLPRRLTLVGRQEPSTLLLRHRNVSRAHCVLYWDGEALWVVDLLSRNGTRLDGRRVSASVVQPGQVLGIGEIELRYLGPDSACGSVIGAMMPAFLPHASLSDTFGASKLSGQETLCGQIAEAELAAAQLELSQERKHSNTEPAAARQVEEQLVGKRQRQEEDLTQARQALAEYQAAADRERQTLADEIERLKAMLTTVEARWAEQLAETHGQAAAAWRTQADMEAAARRREREHQEQLTVWERRFADQAAAHTRHQAELAEASAAERTRLEDELARLRTDLDRTTSALGQAQSDHDRQDAPDQERQQLAEELVRARQTLGEYQAAADRERQMLAGEIERLNGLLVAAEARPIAELAEAHGEVAAAQRAQAMMFADSSRQQTELIDAVRTERSRLEDEVKQLRMDLDRATAALAAAQTDREREQALEAELAAARQRLVELDEALVRARRRLAREWKRRRAQRRTRERHVARLAGERQIEDELVGASRASVEFQSADGQERESSAGEVARRSGVTNSTNERPAVAATLAGIEFSLPPPERIASSELHLGLKSPASVENVSDSSSPRAAARQPAEVCLARPEAGEVAMLPAPTMVQQPAEGILDDLLIGRLLAFKAKRDAVQRRHRLLWIAGVAGLLIAGIVGIVGFQWGWTTTQIESPSQAAEEPVNDFAAFK